MANSLLGYLGSLDGVTNGADVRNDRATKATNANTNTNAPVIIVDTREQEPFAFTGETVEGTLATGDYSVKGLEHLITVERKSLPDLLACVGRERDRFKRELQRLRAYRFRLLVVESDAAELEGGTWQSRVRPSHVLGSLAAWTAQYALPIWLGGNHDACGRFVERYLFQAARTVLNDYAAAGLVMAAMDRDGGNSGNSGNGGKPTALRLCGHAARETGIDVN